MYKILIVDDEALMRRGIKSLVNFDELNIDEVFEASNGEEALETFKNNKIDLVLCDINMPKINGLDFARTIKKISPSVKIALITGYNYFDYAQQAIKIGVEDYILKPVSKSDIREVIMKLTKKIDDEKNQSKLSEVVTTLLKDNGITKENTYKDEISKIIDKKIADDTFSLQVLADDMGFSSGYLSALFKKLFAKSFQNYILDLRLEKAKLLLLTTDMKNYEIASSIGISDVNYFSVRFKKAYGLSPKQYKENVGE